LYFFQPIVALQPAHEVILCSLRFTTSKDFSNSFSCLYDWQEYDIKNDAALTQTTEMAT